MGGNYLIGLCFHLLCLMSCFAKSEFLKLSLNSDSAGKHWTAVGINGTTVLVVSASVPGGIYSDLENNGSIFSSHIYYRYSDVETKWVGWTNWTFSRIFTVTEDVLLKKNVALVCDGLDTVSTVYVNNDPIGSSTNMFVRYVFDIKAALQLGNNSIRVEFQSPVEYAKKQWNEQAAQYPVPPICLPAEYNGECHANHIRKMQASFSWDWGPSYPSSGIWREIRIEAFNGTVIRDVLLFLTPNQTIPDETTNTLWNVTARVWFQSSDEPDSGQLSFQVDAENSSRYEVRKHTTPTNQSSPEDIMLLIPGDQVKMWWPNGYGNRPLYNFTVRYKSSRSPETSSRVLRGGFRTVELIEDPIDSNHLEKGLTFLFRVNGVPVYAKGSNFIPIHVLPERATRNMTQWLLDSAAESNMNMIRVWGGGIYESDAFYDIADENGLMIWEDFMFACAMYPTSPNYLLSVRREVETQVKRLQHHPSIVIWATNNENEAALRGNWYGTKTNYTLYATDYVKLYIDTIKKHVNELDPSRSCLSSSPTNGKGSEAEGWIAKNPYSNLYGDDHFYNYKADGWDWRTYPRTRFASEYGYQSWPSLNTLRTVTRKEDWAWSSPMMSHRQHHPSGQEEMLNETKLHLPLPRNVTDPSVFTSVLYMVQINQAMSVKVQTESYRRLKGQMDKNGEGLNSGALYWQLNDIWQGASWASIEITGRWKMLHYYARNFFSPVIISPFEVGNGDIGVYIVSDRLNPVVGNLRARLFKLDSMTPLWDYEVPVLAEPLSAKQVHVVYSVLLEECQNSLSICFLYFSMPGCPDNFLFLHYPNETTFFHDPNLRFSRIFAHPDRKTFSVTLRASAPAPFVFLNIKANNIQGWFSDNGFIMVTPSKSVTFKSKDELSFNEFQQNLELTSLNDATA